MTAEGGSTPLDPFGFFRQQMDLLFRGLQPGQGTDLVSQVVAPLRRQAELFEQAMESQYARQTELLRQSLEPFAQQGRFLEEAASSIRQQADLYDQTAALLRGQAQLFERMAAPYKAQTQLLEQVTEAARRRAETDQPGSGEASA